MEKVIDLMEHNNDNQVKTLQNVCRYIINLI